MKGSKHLWRIVLSLSLVFAWALHGFSAERPFYKGKTVTILVGTKPGGGYDLYARLLMRHMGKWIPGSPRIVVENMDGAGGLVAANHLYYRAKPDGLTFMVFNHMIIVRQLVGDPNVRIQVRKMNWIGTAAGSDNICVVRSGARYQRIEEMIGAKEPLILGATPRSTREYYPRLVREILGANFKIVTGYGSGGAIYVAVENHEIDGLCGLGWDSLKADRPDWIEKKFVRIFLQLNPLAKVPELADVPWVMDLVKDPKERELVEAAMGTQGIVRSFVAPPGLRSDRLRILRRAFMDTIKDKDFLADAARTKTEMRPRSGEELEGLIKRWFALPADEVAKIRQIYFPRGF